MEENKVVQKTVVYPEGAQQVPPPPPQMIDWFFLSHFVSEYLELSTREH